MVGVGEGGLVWRGLSWSRDAGKGVLFALHLLELRVVLGDKGWKR